MIKKFLALLLAISVMLFFFGCREKSALSLIDKVEDKYGNILQLTYYNENTDEYLIKEFIYELRGNKWVCVDQQSKIVKNYCHSFGNTGSDINNSSLNIYYNNDLTYGPIVIMDNEYVKISIVKYLSSDDWWEFGYELKIYNKTNKVISVIIDDCYIMDIQCKPLFSVDHIDAGKTSYFKIAWDRETIERSRLPYIDNIEFMIRVLDNEDWRVPALVGEQIMIKN